MIGQPLSYAVTQKVSWFVLASAALCAGCGGAGGRFIDVTTKEQFQTMVLESPRPVLVEFYRNGCLGCAMANPKLESLSEAYSDRARFVTVSREVRAVRQKYAISYYPTVIVFHGGRPAGRAEGSKSYDEYAKMIDTALSTHK